MALAFAVVLLGSIIIYLFIGENSEGTWKCDVALGKSYQLSKIFLLNMLTECTAPGPESH